MVFIDIKAEGLSYCVFFTKDSVVSMAIHCYPYCRVICDGGMGLRRCGVLGWPALKWFRSIVGLQNGPDGFKKVQV